MIYDDGHMATISIKVIFRLDFNLLKFKIILCSEQKQDQFYRRHIRLFSSAQVLPPVLFGTFPEGESIPHSISPERSNLVESLRLSPKFN